MGMMGGGGMMQFLIDGRSFDPARVDLTSRVNQVEQWTVRTAPGWITRSTCTARSFR
jgi:FtsP/CotA-like multicopper oxidase with cupredoxin domain